MNYIFFAFLITLFSNTSEAKIRDSLPADQCVNNAPFGFPSQVKSGLFSNSHETLIICREGYVLEYDGNAKIPMWASYKLNLDRAIGCSKRFNKFEEDPSISPKYRAKTTDFRNSGYDIGHLVNSADMRWSDQISEESNVLSNTAPQNPTLNRGAWKQLEEYTRQLTFSRNELLIYVGTIYSRNSVTIGNGKVVVPEYFFKIIIDTSVMESVSFLYPNTHISGEPSFFITTIRNIELKSNLQIARPQLLVERNSIFPVPLKRSNISLQKQIHCNIN